MGEDLTRNAVGLAEPPKRNPNTGAAPAGSAPGKSARGNSAPAAAAAGGTPAAAGSGSPAGGTGTAKAEEKKSVGLASVTPPPVPDTPKKKQRKSAKKKAEPPVNFNAQQISALIVSISAIAAARPGMEMFMISEAEAMTVATPLSNMIAKNENLAVFAQHGDAIALVTACFVIMAPRLMLYFDAQKQKKLNAAGGLKIGNPDSQKRKIDGDNRKAPEHSAPAVSDDDNGIYAAMPSIAY